MNVFLTTLGCRLNEAELQTWSRDFTAAGHAVCDRAEDADVVVVNSCAVTADAAKSSRRLARKAYRNNPAAKLVMTGCYATLEPNSAAAIEGVDLVVANADKAKLPALVADRLDIGDMPAIAQLPGVSFAHRRGRTRAFVKVQDGCRNRCTFCIVTVARGEERSRTVADVVDEVRGLHAAGHDEIVLTGVHLGGYGEDAPAGEKTSLHALIAAVLADTDVPRLRLGSLEPWDLPERFFELWSHPRLMPHLHLPLQSGSDTVLKRMSRRCPTARFAGLVEAGRAQVPDLVVTTDLIVGFPGETDAEFAETLEFIDRMDFAHMHIFQYSPREGTKAARLPGAVALETKRSRSAQAHTVARTMKERVLRSKMGETRQVLWERAGRDGRATGYTDNYLRVVWTSEAPAPGRGEVVPCRIEGLADLASGDVGLAVVPVVPVVPAA